MTPAEFLTANSAESVFAVFRRRFAGPRHRRSKKHTRGCLNEIAFRLNEAAVKVSAPERLSALFGNLADKRIRLAGLTA